MSAVSINYLAVVIAAIAGFLVGFGWYTMFGKVCLAGGARQEKEKGGLQAYAASLYRGRYRVLAHGLDAHRVDGPLG